MSHEQTEEFIDVVRRHPYLYDLEDPRYKDYDKKMNTWRDIAIQFNMKDGNDAKGKWRNLKDSYNKYKKSNAAPPGQVYKKYNKWPWSNYMQFLDVLDKRPKAEDILSGQLSDVGNLTVECEFEPLEVIRPETSFPASSSSKRKKHDCDMRTMIEYFEQRKQDPAVDHIDQLFLNYANTFKYMSSRTQISLKLKMAQIFAEAETEELNLRDSS